MNSKILGHIYMLIVTIIISASFIFVEGLKNIGNPVFIVFYRFLLATVILFLIIIIFFRKDLVNIKKLLLKTSVVGFFYATFFVAQIYALKYTTMLNASSIHTLVPFITYILMVIFAKEKVSTRKLIVYIFAMVSTLWIIFRGDINELLRFKFNIGDLIYLGGSISLVLYLISMKFIYKGEKAIILSFGSLVNGTVLLFLFMLIFKVKFEFQLIDTKSFMSILYLIVFSTVLTMFLSQQAVIYIGSVSVSSYTYLTPSIVLILSWVLYGDIPLPSVVVAAICSSFATFIIQTNFFQDSVKKESK